MFSAAANPLLLAKESEKLLAAAQGTETGISALKVGAQQSLLYGHVQESYV
jgi:hypothetical protein